MKLTTEQLNELLKNNPTLAASNPGLGTYTGHKKLHVLDSGQGKPRVEKTVHKAFRVTITLRYSDNRVRDSDASVSTIFDCLIATRRQMASDSGDARPLHQG